MAIVSAPCIEDVEDAHLAASKIDGTTEFGRVVSSVLKQLWWMGPSTVIGRNAPTLIAMGKAPRVKVKRASKLIPIVVSRIRDDGKETLAEKTALDSGPSVSHCGGGIDVVARLCRVDQGTDLCLVLCGHQVASLSPSAVV